MEPDADVFQALFEEEYSKLFGRVVTGLDVEITVWSVNATTPAEPVNRITERSAETPATSAGQRQLFDAALGRFVTAEIVNRGDMVSGGSVVGPAAITEDETTIIVPTSRLALRQPDGCIDIVLKS